jgi:Ni/Co efflux regulator RcnB
LRPCCKPLLDRKGRVKGTNSTPKGRKARRQVNRAGGKISSQAKASNINRAARVVMAATAQASRGQSGREGGRPPQDFAPIRQTISEHRESFGRGNALPANIRVERGHPLPRGYGRPLNAAALNQLPHYEGYQWRRLGSDVVLVAIGTGLVYEILSGVLN